MTSISVERDELLRAGRGEVVALAIPARAEYVALCRLALTGIARTRALAPERVAASRSTFRSSDAADGILRRRAASARKRRYQAARRLRNDREPWSDGPDS